VKLLIFSDIHNDWKTLAGLLDMEADYYIAAGDQVTWARGIEPCGELLARRGDRVYVLPGNHESAEQVAGMCARHGLHNLHERYFEVGRYRVAGLGYSSPTPFNTPGEYSEEQIAARLEKFANLSPLVLVCHCPPWGTALDRVSEGVHAGSTAVRNFLEQAQPEWFFSGHIHEATGTAVEIGRTRAVSVGKRGYLLELD
jgi:Icc-related predicted phosphoesterase